VNRSLTHSQAVVLGIVVIACLAVGAWGMFRIGQKSGMLGDTYEVVVYVPDAQDVDRGTPVRIRGVEAGKVTAIEYVEDDGDEGMVRLRLQLDKKYEERLFADATAALVTKGMFGSTFVAIQPGKASAGPLASKVIRSKQSADLAEVTAKLSSVASRVDNVLKEVEAGDGTAGKLVKDGSLYNEVKLLAVDARKLINNANEAITSLRGDAQQTMYDARKAIDGINASVASVQGEVAGLKDLVRISKEAITAIKQDAEAIKSLPIVRNYVTDEVKVLVRPSYSKDRVLYSIESLFEPNQAVLTADGRKRIGESAAWLRGQKQKGSEIVIAAFADPANKNETSASARELTKKQSEIVADLLKDQGAAKMGTFSSNRNIIPLGFGFDPSPVVEKDDLPRARLEVILFVPR
jgi:phospholipid/cholesterol/gamma-HCH transport system substrate-binding protein